MDVQTAVYTGLVSLFTYSAVHLVNQVSDFLNFEKRYGRRPDITLNNLIDEAENQGRDLPSFKVFIPAYKESEVIEGSIRNLVKSNYPSYLYEINIVTNEEDLEPTPKTNTTSIVEQVAEVINSEKGYNLVKSIIVPESYDGFFPGEVNSDVRRKGKPKALNYAIRKTHEDNEADERKIFLGSMYENSHVQYVDYVVDSLSNKKTSLNKLEVIVKDNFSQDSKNYIGTLALSRQFMEIVEILNTISSSETISSEATRLLENYVFQQASKFFFEIEDVEYSENTNLVKPQVMPGKEFLFDVMKEIEDINSKEIIDYYNKREMELEKTMPVLSQKLQATNSSEEIYQLTKQINSRWMMVFDADADAPRDVMRFYAARILTDESVMAFQGPVAPIGNLDDVKMLPRMAGYQMAFYHFALYPRVLSNDRLAHPLAGTNWCLRLDGIKEDDTLIRIADYDESKREFLAFFKPESLTEDLELGIRMFEDYGINAQWHPYVEIEQVPPDTKGLLRQRIRWADGTMELLKYITKSSIPVDQKIYYLSYPVRALLSALTPTLSLGYIVAHQVGSFDLNLVYGDYPLWLAATNLVYGVGFLLPYMKTKKYLHANYPYDELYNIMDDIVSSIGKEKGDIEFSDIERELLEDSVSYLQKGLDKKGFITEFLGVRTTEDDLGENKSSVHNDEQVISNTHFIHSRQDYEEKVNDFSMLMGKNGSELHDNENSSMFLDDLMRLNEIVHLSDKNPNNLKRMFETFYGSYAYMFHDMRPPNVALWKHITGQRSTGWDKTERTKKNVI